MDSITHAEAVLAEQFEDLPSATTAAATELFSEHQVGHMQMIQASIERMATTSSVLKGFAATTFSAFVALTYDEISMTMIVIALLPGIGFLLLDTYYLMLERKYRHLYEQVRRGCVPADYSMVVSHIDAYSCSWLKAFSSKSIILFYLPLAIAYALLISFKAYGI